MDRAELPPPAAQTPAAAETPAAAQTPDAARTPDGTGPCIVQLTAPTAEEAGRLGRLAVERRLAACAQIGGPVTSTYRWHGEVETATEWVCTLKTVGPALPALTALLRHAHSYDVPEIVAVPVAGGDPDYLAWVAAEAASDP